MEHRKTILVDFDGVLHAYNSPWQGPAVIPDGPVPGAFEWLTKMVEDGRFDVCIYSSRSSDPAGVEAMHHWLVTNGLHPSICARLRFPTIKPGGFLTIDDRAFCFQGVFPDPDEIAAFVPWNKRTKAAGVG